MVVNHTGKSSDIHKICARSDETEIILDLLRSKWWRMGEYTEQI